MLFLFYKPIITTIWTFWSIRTKCIVYIFTILLLILHISK